MNQTTRNEMLVNKRAEGSSKGSYSHKTQKEVNYFHNQQDRMIPKKSLAKSTVGLQLSGGAWSSWE